MRGEFDGSLKCWLVDNLIVVFTSNAIHELQNFDAHTAHRESPGRPRAEHNQKLKSQVNFLELNFSLLFFQLFSSNTR